MAAPEFGNVPDGSYGYGIYSSYPNPYITGAAVSFTPTQDITLSSVSLWLSGYTQPFSLELLQGNDPNFLAFVSLFFAAAPNDGSLSQFTFNVSITGMPGDVTLQANNTYWLFAYGNYTSSELIDWVGGSTPIGAAVYNGTATYQGDPVGTFPPGLNASAPAFTLNSVPEPSTMSFAIAGAGTLFFSRCLRQILRRKKACAQRAKTVRTPQLQDKHS